MLFDTNIKPHKRCKASCCNQTPIAPVPRWGSLGKPGLGGTIRGLVAHGIQGFVYERARADLGIPNSVDVMAMIAIRKRWPKENLSMNVQENTQMAENHWGK